jgi:SAM-dependent methyltransferase
MTYRQKIFNNVVINNIAIFFRIDKYLKRANNYWKNYKVIIGKTDQEVAGYSHVNDVQEAVDKTHAKLMEISRGFIKTGGDVLDIGCGPGLYLKDFDQTFNLHGIDINTKMLELAKKNNPRANFYEGEFLSTNIGSKFDLIYSVGMLQYISKGEIKPFFEKIFSLLNKDGIAFISYPHAINIKDLFYPDINYINYSPLFLKHLILDKFMIIQNKHVIDDREILGFDKTPYFPSIKGFDKTYRNSSILIAQKKDVFL